MVHLRSPKLARRGARSDGSRLTDPLPLPHGKDRSRISRVSRALDHPAPSPGASTRVRFGDLAVDLRSGDVDGPDRRARLSEQPLAVLTALLARPGDLVT